MCNEIKDNTWQTAEMILTSQTCQNLSSCAEIVCKAGNLLPSKYQLLARQLKFKSVQTKILCQTVPNCMAKDFLEDLVCFAFLSSSLHSSFSIVLIAPGVCLQEWQSSVSGGSTTTFKSTQSSLRASALRVTYYHYGGRHSTLKGLLTSFQVILTCIHEHFTLGWLGK